METPKRELATSPIDRDSQTPTPRRKPHCRTCGSPRLGHKRGPCLTLSGSPAARDAIPKKEEQEPVDLSAKFKGLQIMNDEDQEKERKARRSSALPPPRAATLISLASGDIAVLDALGKPGMMSDVVDENEKGVKSGIEKWLENLPPSDSPKQRQKRSPRPSVLDSSPDMLDFIRDSSNLGSMRQRPSLARSAKPVGRASNAHELKAFFTALTEKTRKPVVSVFTIDMRDIHELEENAKRLKFHARVIAPEYTDGTTGDGWLVIGKDESSVEEVFKEVEKDVTTSKSLVSTAFSSGAVGAIATWMYLAFS